MSEINRILEIEKFCKEYISDDVYFLNLTENRFSNIAILKTQKTKETYYIKDIASHRELTRWKHRIKNELAILSELHDSIKKDANFSVVKAVCTGLENTILITEACNGKSYSIFLNNILNFRKNLKLATFCGEYLKYQHDYFRKKIDNDKSIDTYLSELTEYIELRIDLLELDKQNKQNLKEKLKQLKKDFFIKASLSDISLCHNDFAPHNIIINDNEKPVVLDFTMADFGFIHDDLSNFIINIKKSNTLFKNLVINNFLQGYGIDEEKYTSMSKIFDFKKIILGLINHNNKNFFSKYIIRFKLKFIYGIKI